MTKEQFKEINARLEKWRESRDLTLESQKQGLVLNLLEELVEFGRAKNEYEKIDALCDMYVFLLNAYEIESLPDWKLDSIAVDFGSLLSTIETICNWKYSEIILDFEVSFDEILQGLALRFELAMKDLGYEPYLCMYETLQEIESRVGAYNPVLKKWCKDFSLEAQAKWYKADYAKCKLDSKKEA